MVEVKNGQRQEGQLSLAYAPGKPFDVGLSWLCLASPGDVCSHCLWSLYQRMLCFTDYGLFFHVTGEVVEFYIILANTAGVIWDWSISIV